MSRSKRNRSKRNPTYYEYDEFGFEQPWDEEEDEAMENPFTSSTLLIGLGIAAVGYFLLRSKSASAAESAGEQFAPSEESPVDTSVSDTAASSYTSDWVEEQGWEPTPSTATGASAPSGATGPGESSTPLPPEEQAAPPPNVVRPFVPPKLDTVSTRFPSKTGTTTVATYPLPKTDLSTVKTRTTTTTTTPTIQTAEFKPSSLSTVDTRTAATPVVTTTSTRTVRR